ncbi:MAG: tetratricopeptide repeat protein [Bryobacteraceae bacterium]
MLRAALFTLALLCAAEDYQAEGLKALEANNYTQAAELFGKAVAADPADYAAHFHLALAYSLMHKGTEAAAGYRKTLELKPGLYEAELNLGIVLLGLQQASEAATWLEGAAAKKPTAYRARFYAGEAQWKAGDFAKAEAHYRAAVELDPKSAPAALGLGRVLAKQNRLSGAAPHFRKAAELDGGFRDALLELASLFEAAGQPGDAIAIYSQFPDHVAARERLGKLLLDAKRYPEAIASLEATVERDPSAANRLALAHAYRTNKQAAKALPLLEKAVAQEPSSFDLRMIYGSVLRDEKQYPPAAAQFFAAAKLKPDSKEAWSELGGLLTLLEQYPQALAALDRVRALGGELPGHLFFRAIILDKTKQYKPALDEYERFLARSEGKFPTEEFQARQRVRIIRKELSKH